MSTTFPTAEAQGLERPTSEVHEIQGLRTVGSPGSTKGEHGSWAKNVAGSTLASFWVNIELIYDICKY